MELNLPLFQHRLEEQKYSESSIRSYMHCIKQLYNISQFSSDSDLEVNTIRKHMYWLIQEKGISPSYQKQILISIQKYADLVLQKRLDLTELYPKNIEYKLPSCISKKDINEMLDKTENLKHKAIICLIYSGGLRLSDLLSLKLQDIDPEKKAIHIRETKDRRERTLMLSPFAFEVLKQYYQEYSPQNFVFEGQMGKAFSAKSVQLIVKQAAAKAGINKQVTPHCLRHSFASHLVESGVDLHHIQNLLGHQSIKTTEVYTLVSDVSQVNIISPIDSPKE